MDALAGLVPTADNYAALPVGDAFNWAECSSVIEPGDWYLVAFRSIIRSDADLAVLTAYDDLAHAEASTAPGFVHYYKGPLADDGSCLSFCMWNSRAEARATSGRPAHQEAVALVSRMYAAYTLEFIGVRKSGREAALEFTQYDSPQRPAPSTVPSSTSLGFSPAAS